MSAASKTQGSAPITRRIGMSVRNRRKTRKLSQEELAELTDLSKNYIGNIERGEYEATISTLRRIAASLECRVADILDEADV